MPDDVAGRARCEVPTHRGDAARRSRAWASALSLVAVLVPVVVRLTGWEQGPLAYAVSLLPWVVPACVVPLALALLGAVTGARGRCACAPRRERGLACARLHLLLRRRPAPVELRVATLNATLGQADADAIVAMVADQSIDVLAVEELTPAEVDALRAAGLDDALPYSELAPQDGVRGTGVWSRLAFDSADVVSGLRAQVVRVSVDAWAPSP